MLAHLKDALEEHGAEVIALSSAQSALELLTAQRANVHGWRELGSLKEERNRGHSAQSHHRTGA
jgi:hypothetical protein